MSKAQELYRKAYEAHHEDDDIPWAASLYQQVIDKYPDTESALKAGQQLQRIGAATASAGGGLDEGSEPEELAPDYTAPEESDPTPESTSSSNATQGTSTTPATSSSSRSRDRNSRKNEEFGALRFVSTLFKVFGVVLGFAGGMLLVTELAKNPETLTSVLAQGLGLAFSVLICFAISDGIKVFLAIEENTRKQP